MEEFDLTGVYRRYGQDLFRFCLSIVGNPEDAQDALQNTMVKALRSLPGEQRQIQLKPWLYRVAHNESVELLRRRRNEARLDPELTAGGGELSDVAATRERLRRLLDDLGELPERQHAALVMRELAGLGFTQIGEALETSAAVARQTVYEARLGLRQLEAGREMDCEKVTWQLSEADGRVLRRRDIQAHLRDCAECREFRDSIASRRRDLASLAPLPAAASSGILHALLEGAGGNAGTGLTGAATAGAGKAVATSVVVKSVATVAVVATIGVTAADRGGLIDAGLPGDGGNRTTRHGEVAVKAKSLNVAGSDPSPAARAIAAKRKLAEAAKSRIAGRHPAAARSLDRTGGAPRSATVGEIPPAGDNRDQGPPASLPQASGHGQQTAATHKAQHGPGSARAHGNAQATSPNSAHKGSGPHGPSAHSHGQSSGHSQGGGSHHSHEGASGKGASGPHEQAHGTQPKLPPDPAPTEEQGSPPAEAGNPNAGGKKSESSP
jgi:RNA polymerase sigma factor (sigma-70 family)